MLRRIGLTLLIYSIVCIIVYAFLDQTLDGYTLNFLRDFLGYPLYYMANANRDATTICVYFVGVVAIILYYLIVTLSHVSILADSMHSLTDEHMPVPTLHSDYHDIENTMRDIKMRVSAERIAAQETEQRKNDLVVYLAHDLKTPLSSIIGYLTLLDESPELSAEQRAKFTGIALNKALRLEELINEFFEITRFNLQRIELERSTIDLSMMLQQITDEFYPVFAEHDLCVELSVPSGVKIVGDADKLARVFDNLLRNAVNYSYPHTPVCIALHDTEDFCTVTVRNQGDEIPPEKLDRIFEQFFRVDTARGTGRGGSGLGLAIARQIVELHGGQILAQSSVESTVFSVVLPHRSEKSKSSDRKM